MCHAGLRSLICTLVLLVLTCGLSAAQPAPAPWERTERRAPCTDFSVLRRPLVGELHLHTGFSIDALVFDDRNEPRDAYRFARGLPIGIAPYDAMGQPLRTVQLDRRLDFAAVTDHAEGFGVETVCLTPGLPGYDAPECAQLRSDVGSFTPGNVPASFLSLVIPGVIAPNAPPPGFCGAVGAICRAQDSVIWQAVQAAAEEFYDRTDACSFTTLVAYEWSGTPFNANLHRNVIFRNEQVPALPTSYIQEPTVQGLWARLQAQCRDGLDRCDVLAIPHNSNVSNGLMFEPVNADGSPLNAADAATRAGFEPLVEMFQHKGDSECRPGVGTVDELCGFEKLTRATLFGGSAPSLYPPLGFVRNALKEGLVQEQALGANQFKLGFIGATDTHNATAGAADEDRYPSHLGTLDATAAFRLTNSSGSNIENNPGGNPPRRGASGDDAPPQHPAALDAARRRRRRPADGGRDQGGADATGAAHRTGRSRERRARGSLRRRRDLVGNVSRAPHASPASGSRSPDDALRLRPWRASAGTPHSTSCSSASYCFSSSSARATRRRSPWRRSDWRNCAPSSCARPARPRMRWRRPGSSHANWMTSCCTAKLWRAALIAAIRRSATDWSRKCAS